MRVKCNAFFSNLFVLHKSELNNQSDAKLTLLVFLSSNAEMTYFPSPKRKAFLMYFGPSQ